MVGRDSDVIAAAALIEMIGDALLFATSDMGLLHW
jgi:hypothetical protein